MPLTLTQRRLNVAIAAASVILWIAVSKLTGRISEHNGLGLDYAAFDDMVRGFTLKGGDELTRLSPLFPALAWIPYLLTGDVPRSLAVVNALSMGVLSLAACEVIDGKRGDVGFKVWAALNLVLLIAFARVAAYVPGSPELCALAALMLAIAMSPLRFPLMTAAASAAAVMAMPIGLAAPVYGALKSMRLRVPPFRIALMFGPAVVMWALVQWWARGGIAGAVGDFMPSALLRSVDVWSQPIFLAFAAYFLVTGGGGFGFLALSNPGVWVRAIKRSPETLSLLALTIAYVGVSGSVGPSAFGFLVPVWVLLSAEWCALTNSRRSWMWLGAGLAFTVVTQRSLMPMGSLAYFVDWHPYDVYRGSAPVHYDQLFETWTPRFLVAAIVLWLGALATARRGVIVEVSEDSPPPVPARTMREEWTVAIPASPGWRWAGYGWATLLAGLTGYFLFQVPIQLSDSLANLLQVQNASVGALVASQLGSRAYLRPTLWAGLKVVFDLSGGHYFLWFRSLHVMLLLALLVSVVAIMRVRTAADFVAAIASLAMVVGLHTFAGTIREAFPVNTFLVAAICCTVALAVSRAEHHRWSDAVPAVLLLYAAFAVETGLLVWVVCVAAYVAGDRGVSRRGIWLLTALVAAYFVLRFGILHVGTPGLEERQTGFGFERLEPSALIARFGANPLPLYAYNVGCAIVTVLVGDPRGGVWLLPLGLLSGDVAPFVVLNVATCVLTTLAIAIYVGRRRREWLRWDLNDGDRLIVVFLAVLLANAAISFAYLKDVIMSPAGVFYAIAAFVAFRGLLTTPPMPVRPALLAAIMLTSMGWGIRVLGIEYSLRETAATVRTDWAFEYEWEAQNHISFGDSRQAALKDQLVEDAIWTHPAPRRISLGWPERLLDRLP